jgi:TonB family protein
VSLPWLLGAALSMLGHGALAVWLGNREPAPRPPPPRPMRLAFTRLPAPPPPPKVEPPPVEPPPVVRPRIRPRARRPESPRTTATRTHVEPTPSGLTPDRSAAQGGLQVLGGSGVSGPVQPGEGPPRPPTPPAAARPARRYVPIFEVTRLPRAVRAIQPEVPPGFDSARREAVVVVEVSITATGVVVDARVVKKAGFGLDEAAVSAARRTRFEPALVGDRPVAVRMQIPYRFKVRG